MNFCRAERRGPRHDCVVKSRHRRGFCIAFKAALHNALSIKTRSSPAVVRHELFGDRIQAISIDQTWTHIWAGFELSQFLQWSAHEVPRQKTKKNQGKGSPQKNLGYPGGQKLARMGVGVAPARGPPRFIREKYPRRVLCPPCLPAHQRAPLS